MKYVEAVANIVCATLLDPKVLQKARRRKRIHEKQRMFALLDHDEAAFV